MLYLISYDLNDPGQDYSKIQSAICRLGECYRILYSTWVVKTNLNANGINSSLKQVTDENDRYFIVDISKRDKSGWLEQKACDWLNQHDI